MPYIKNEDHFVNFLNIMIRENLDVIDVDDLLDKEFYVKKIYNTGMADDYTAALKFDRNFNALTFEGVREFLEQKNLRKTFVAENFEYIPRSTDEWKEIIPTLHDQPGVYCFLTSKGKFLYVGSSKNLSNRIPSSANEKISRYRHSIKLRVYKTTASDAIILESYFIATKKPLMNTVGKYGDNATLELKNMPKYDFEIKFIGPIKNG